MIHPASKGIEDDWAASNGFLRHHCAGLKAFAWRLSDRTGKKMMAMVGVCRLGSRGMVRSDIVEMRVCRVVSLLDPEGHSRGMYRRKADWER